MIITQGHLQLFVYVVCSIQAFIQEDSTLQLQKLSPFVVVLWLYNVL